MARTATTAQTVTFAGIAPTYETPDNSNGNYVTYSGGKYLIHVKNTNGSTRTLTLTTTGVIDGISITSPTRTIAATTGDHFFLLDAEAARLAVGGQLLFDWSASAGVTYAVFKV